MLELERLAGITREARQGIELQRSIAETKREVLRGEALQRFRKEMAGVNEKMMEVAQTLFREIIMPTIEDRAKSGKSSLRLSMAIQTGKDRINVPPFKEEEKMNGLLTRLERAHVTGELGQAFLQSLGNFEPHDTTEWMPKGEVIWFMDQGKTNGADLVFDSQCRPASALLLLAYLKAIAEEKGLPTKGEFRTDSYKISGEADGTPGSTTYFVKGDVTISWLPEEAGNRAGDK